MFESDLQFKTPHAPDLGEMQRPQVPFLQSGVKHTLDCYRTATGSCGQQTASRVAPVQMHAAQQFARPPSSLRPAGSITLPEGNYLKPDSADRVTVKAERHTARIAGLPS